MKIFVKNFLYGGQAVYAHNICTIRAAEAQRVGRWNATTGDYDPVEIDESQVYECNTKLAVTLEENGFYDGVVTCALNSLYLDAEGICHARSLEA